MAMDTTIIIKASIFLFFSFLFIFDKSEFIFHVG